MYKKIPGGVSHRGRRAAEEKSGGVKDQLQEFENFAGAVALYPLFLAGRPASFLDYFPEDTKIYLDEPARILENAGAMEEEFRESMVHRLEKGYVLPGQTKLLRSYKEVVHQLDKRGCVSLSTLEPRLEGWPAASHLQVTARSVNGYNNSFELLVKDLKQWKKAGYRVILLSGSRTRAARLAEDLRQEGLNSFISERIRPG